LTRHGEFFTLFHAQGKKGIIIMAKNAVLNGTTERQFLIDVACILQRSDLSNLDLRTTEGPEKYHRTHNALIDNYEISISRTPVYGFQTPLHQLLGIGEWMLSADRYERFEVCICENMYSIRFQETPFSNILKNNRNVIMHHGTMSNSSGYYRASAHQKRGLTSSMRNDLYHAANCHLFEPCRDIYQLLDAESMRRRLAATCNLAPVIHKSTDIPSAQQRMLSCIEQHLLKTK